MTPESQSRRLLLGNNYVNRFAATDNQAIIEVLLSYNDGNRVFCWIRPEAV
jgi:hypothetical protein